MTLGTIAVIQFSPWTVFNLSPLIILLAIIALVAFTSGLRGGLMSATLVSAYVGYVLSKAGWLFFFHADGGGVLLFVVVAYAIAVMMGLLRRSARSSVYRLRQQLDYSRAIDLSIGEGVYVLDHAGRITFMNPAAEQMLGWTETELLGKLMHDVIGQQPRDGASQPSKVWGRLQALLGDTVHRSEDEFFIRKDGTTFPVAYSSAPIIRNGRLDGAVVAFRDITARKQTEEELQARARQQAAVATLGQRAIAVPDIGTLMREAVTLVAQTLDVEYCRILELLPDRTALLLRAGIGWKEGHVGQTMLATGTDSQAGYTLLSNSPVVVNDLRTETRFRVPTLLQQHDIVSGMSVIIHGQECPFGVLGVDTVQQRIFTNDDVHFLQAVANVLTAAIERTAYEEQLARQRSEATRIAERDQIRHEFILSISHDLRTPLTAVRAGLGLLESSASERLELPEQQLLHNTRRNVERLRLLIDDLLTSNQIEAGTLYLRHDALDLRTVVLEAISAVYALLQEKKQTLEIHLPEPLPIMGDPRRLTQVVVNLLANAHYHTSSGTRLAMMGWCTDHEIHLVVSDNGPGIAVEVRDRIFQRFHRLGAVAVGSGLGLAIARSILELHKGRIWLEPAVHPGAMFHIALPRRAEGEKA